MRITTWNARGLNAPSKKRILKHNLKNFESDIILIQETKLNKSESSSLGRSIGNWSLITQEAAGASGGLGVIWNLRKVNLDILSLNNNWVSCKCHSLKSNLSFIIINVYGPCINLEKRRVWNEISNFLFFNQNEMIIIGGDFNTILDPKEKIGGSSFLSNSSKDFKSWCEQHNLIDIPTNNGIYTWNNRRKDFAYIAEKLDRFLVKGDLDFNNLNISASILPITGSDHFPVRLDIEEPHKPVRNSFKCEKMWFLDQNFLANIKLWWSQGTFEGSKMFIFMSKIKMLKDKILYWNKTHFNNIFIAKSEVEDKLKELNSKVIRLGMDNESYLLEKELLAKQEDLLSKEEIFWKQKSREKWLEEGDRNTKFFHNSTLINRAKNKISSIKTQDGSITENPTEIAATFVNHFQSLLNNFEGSNRMAQSRMLEVIPKIINKEDNKALNKPITLEEVRKVVFDLNPDKSPGPDGFQAFFYQKCWDIIGTELWEAIEASRRGGSILAEINYSFFTLIPKKSDPTTPGDYRPIALCNTIYKIFAKILANRLKPLLSKVISEEQTGFVPGRSILDGIITIQETIHSAQKTKKACMFMKLDIQKAYDMVDWRFLCKTLEAFGFAHQWINLIFKCISTTKISVLINGSPEGFFDISRGIRQGDPLSPFLYIIMAEAFGRSFSKALVERKLKGVLVTKNVPNITHQQYADDTILPGESSIEEAIAVKNIIDDYMSASGQKVNNTKSEILFMNTDEKLEFQICSIMGYKKGEFPCKYLGIELGKEGRSCKNWNKVIDKLDSKMSDWKGKWLTKAGKRIKISSVLTAIPTYPLSCLPLPKLLQHKIEAKLRNFLWNDCENSNKLALVKWDQISKPKEFGGLGIKNLQFQNKALGAKLVWRLYNERDQKWAKILFNKYLNIEDPTSVFRARLLPKGSENWNFITSCRNLINRFLTWDVGNGKSAFFWEDSWDGYPPLERDQSLSTLKAKLCNCWGSKVSDYKTKVTNGHGYEWIWKSIRGIENNPVIIQRYENLILVRKIQQSEKEDKLIWAASNNGQYSVKLGYNALLQSENWEKVEIPLKLCWDPACLPKAGFFLWLAFQNRILTQDRLKKFGFCGPSRCILCKTDAESVDHLLYNCVYSKTCWEWLVKNLNWSAPFPRTFVDFLISWPYNHNRGVYSKLWNICPSILVWEVWKERNRRIFSNLEMEPKVILRRLEASIVETMNSFLSKVRMEEGTFSSWDGLIKKVWPNLINPPLTYSKHNKEARKLCRWTPPPKGWIKLNFDGAARGNPGIAGLGVIINNEEGLWLAKKAAPIEPTSNNLAELRALEEGLLLCIKLGVSKIIIEGDSQIVLNAIRKKSTPNWVINSKLECIVNLLDKFEDTRIEHIFREGNVVADKLANMGADGQNILLFSSR